MEFTLDQAENLVQMFNGNREITITVVRDDRALLAYETELPEEGSIEL